MTLADLYTLKPSLRGYLQDAFWLAVRRVSLVPQAFPCRFTGSAVFGDVTLPGTLLSGSEIIFKSVPQFPAATIINGPHLPAVGTAVSIGNWEGPTFGWSDFDTLNENHAIAPELEITDGIVTCSNLDECFVWALGYAFPYFVLADDPYDVKHQYSIGIMEIDYGADALTVDPVLLYPVIAYATAALKRDGGDFVGASLATRAATQYLNLYSMSIPSFLAHASSTTLDGLAL